MEEKAGIQAAADRRSQKTGSPSSIPPAAAEAAAAEAAAASGPAVHRQRAYGNPDGRGT